MDPFGIQGFQVKSIWKVCVPTGMAFFLGCVTLDKTLSTDNLKKLRVGHYGLVLYVQETQREYGSSLSTLRGGSRAVVFGFLSIWGFLGNALFCFGIVMVLEAMFWIDKQYGDLERCSFVFLNFEDFMIGLCPLILFLLQTFQISWTL